MSNGGAAADKLLVTIVRLIAHSSDLIELLNAKSAPIWTATPKLLVAQRNFNPNAVRRLF